MAQAAHMGEPDSLEDRWYVTNGVVAVGPLDYGRLAQGVAHGRIPSTSFIRHYSWRVWRRFSDLQALSPADRSEVVHRLAGLSAGADERAADPRLSEPPPPFRSSGYFERSPDSHPPLSSVRPAAVHPVGVLRRAEDLEDALLLTLSTAVAAANADIGLLHRDRRELDVTVTSYAHGQDSEHLLGDRLSEDDPSLLAARAGLTVVGEPDLGDAGRYIAGRMSRCSATVTGVAMVPVLVSAQLVAMLEVGRIASHFRAREVARVEDVAEALAAQIVVRGWGY